MGGCGGELCADGRNLPTSPGSADFRELRSVLEQSPGGMCYYTGLDEPGGARACRGCVGTARATATIGERVLRRRRFPTVRLV